MTHNCMRQVKKTKLNETQLHALVHTGQTPVRSTPKSTPGFI